MSRRAGSMHSSPPICGNSSCNPSTGQRPFGPPQFGIAAGIKQNVAVGMLDIIGGHRDIDDLPARIGVARRRHCGVGDHEILVEPQLAEIEHMQLELAPAPILTVRRSASAERRAAQAGAAAVGRRSHLLDRSKSTPLARLKEIEHFFVLKLENLHPVASSPSLAAHWLVRSDYRRQRLSREASLRAAAITTNYAIAAMRAGSWRPRASSTISATRSRAKFGRRSRLRTQILSRAAPICRSAAPDGCRSSSPAGAPRIPAECRCRHWPRQGGTCASKLPT